MDVNPRCCTLGRNETDECAKNAAERLTRESPGFQKKPRLGSHPDRSRASRGADNFVRSVPVHVLGKQLARSWKGPRALISDPFRRFSQTAEPHTAGRWTACVDPPTFDLKTPFTAASQKRGIGAPNAKRGRIVIDGVDVWVVIVGLLTGGPSDLPRIRHYRPFWTRTCRSNYNVKRVRGDQDRLQS